MVPVETLSPGVRVKIVEQWNDNSGQNLSGLMDKYLGQIVTVLDIQGNFVYIEEDNGDCSFHESGHWNWNKFCFDYIVEDGAQEDFEPSSNNEIFSLIFGN